MHVSLFFYKNTLKYFASEKLKEKITKEEINIWFQLIDIEKGGRKMMQKQLKVEKEV